MYFDILHIALTVACNYFNYYIKDGNMKKESNPNLRKGKKGEKRVMN